MKFCRHDWTIHKHGKFISKRYKYLVGDASLLNLDSDINAPILIAGLGICSVYAIFSIALWKFGMDGIDAILVSLIPMLIYAAIHTFAHEVIKTKGDVWHKTDKTCVKCDKVVLNATKQEEANTKRAEQAEIEQKYNASLALKQKKQRDILVVKADERYAKWLAIRSKAK